MTDQTSFDTATRVAAGDDGTNYDRLAIALHWTMVVLVLLQFALGQTWGWFAKPTHRLMVVTHMSFGIILTVVVLASILWRLLGHQKSSLEVGWVRIASKAVHYSLYALLITEAVLGFMARWQGNEAMNFFGLQIPGPFVGGGKQIAHQLEDIHNWVGWAIIVLAAGHAAAALYHHFVLKDRVLERMLPAAAQR